MEACIKIETSAFWKPANGNSENVSDMFHVKLLLRGIGGLPDYNYLQL